MAQQIPPAIVVADSSPLIALAAVGCAHLLQDLFGEILIPIAVWDELVAGAQHLHRSDLLTAPWLIRARCHDSDLLLRLSHHLDRGEAEAITLAVEKRADSLLMDERIGRREAAHYGLQVIGTAGILLRAKQLGRITAVAPLLAQMREAVGFRLNEQITAAILREAGEL